MDELSWFLSTLTARDYLPVARIIPGFPQDLRNPVGVKKQVEEALQRGFKKPSGHRTKLPQIHLRELYQKIGSEYLKNSPHLISESVEDLVLKLQVEPKIKPYQQIAILYTMFTDEFDKLLPNLIASEVKAKNPLEALSGAESAITKLGVLLGRDTFESLIPEIQNFLQKTESNLVCKDLEELLSELRNVGKGSRLPILFSFLTDNENYNRSDYLFLCEYTIQDYYVQRNEALRNEITQLKAVNDSQTREIRRQNNRLRELETIEAEVATQKKLLDEIRSQQEVSAAEYQNVSVQKEKILTERDIAQRWRNDFQQFISEIKARDDRYVIVTDDTDGVICSTLSMITISKDDLLKIRRPSTWTNKYKGSLFFLFRNSFASTEEWNDFTMLLDKLELEYKEVTGYEEMGHLAQIINYLLEEK